MGRSISPVSPDSPVEHSTSSSELGKGQQHLLPRLCELFTLICVETKTTLKHGFPQTQFELLVVFQTTGEAAKVRNGYSSRES